jgi:hypothetical protein
MVHSIKGMGGRNHNRKKYRYRGTNKYGIKETERRTRMKGQN